MSDIGHCLFSYDICDKSQTHMCHMALTESVDTTLRSVVTLQNEGHVRWATVWEQTCPRAVIERT